ncbi:hydroxysqualene dehydroxylase [Halobacterium jilantaiense]|uniref:NAD-binding domain and a Fe-S cluster-containing protein n=1 Tax=Halobacterium jilantaiense TaxID=355548 RepID=A0A1I0P0Q6_9EURY|nr:FAD-dependent oxidoreductase [Halobacterium jilantaiense]SEW07056.1 NAD-binding domain and a Fe-S cluster-containing protein [Halobacterium jilantaiense]
MPDSRRVAVLGGGIAGLTAAQELAERGFDVTVYEANDRVGGKARSMPVDETAGDDGLLGEHGFRFFPAYYRNVVETMERIPDGTGRSVADHLVPTTETLIASADGEGAVASTEKPSTPREWLDALQPQIAGGEVPRRELAHFVSRLAVLLTSCDERREQEFERQSWWDFIDADEMSPAYRKHLAQSTQALVALRPEVGSARTVGTIYLQLLFGQLDPNAPAERVLDGPTSEVWLDHWHEYLESQGVDIHLETPVSAIHSDGRRVTGVEVGGETVTADHYVAALPVDVLPRFLSTDLRRAAPSLAGVERIQTAWMNGVQFYLDRDVEVVGGHAVYVDSPWAITSISQRQFWADHDVEARSDGEVEGVLSVIASDWDTPGILYDKPGRECTREEAVEEMWAQVQGHLGEAVLPDDARVAHFLDPELVETDEGLRNDSPLVINTVDSLRNRPDPDTDAPNLAVAGDYARVDTDLATMEAANEAGRRAANAVLDAEGHHAPRVEVWGLDEPRAFEPLKRQDRVRFKLGLPHPGEVGHDAWKFARELRP